MRPFFRDYQPREIDAWLIDRYRNDRLAAGLSASSINKTINTLAAILDLAEDYALLGERGNPAHGKRRKAKETKVERDRRRLRSWADYDPLMVLLEAARDLDKNSSRYPTTYAGNRRNGNNVRSRIFRPCIRRAHQILGERTRLVGRACDRMGHPLSYPTGSCPTRDDEPP